MITPFTEDGRINEGALRALLHRLADASLEVWLVSSGTAEANVLSDGEIDRVVAIAVEEIGTRTPLFAMGCEPRSARREIDWANRMADLGVHGVQIGPLEPGHGYRPTEADLRTFHHDVLSNVSVPCYLASHMSVGYQVPPAVLADAAAEHGQVAGFVACHLDNFPYCVRLIDLSGGRPVLLGSPFQALDGLASGAAGVVSSMDAFVAPRLYRDLGDAWQAGDLGRVSQLHATAVRLFCRILGGGGLVVLKAVLDHLGLEGGPPRPPRQPASARVRELAARIVDEFGLAA